MRGESAESDITSCHGIRTAPKQSALFFGCMEDDRTPYYTPETCLVPAIYGD